MPTRIVGSRSLHTDTQSPVRFWNVFLSTGWFDAVDADAVTDQQIKDLVARNARVDPSDYDLALLDNELRHEKLERHGRDSHIERQVWRLCLKYTSTLQKCGYDEIVKQ